MAWYDKNVIILGVKFARVSNFCLILLKVCVSKHAALLL